PYLLRGMPLWERRCLARVVGISDERPTLSGPWVVYWVQNTFRVLDNVALSYAMRLSRTTRLPLIVFAFASNGRENSMLRCGALASLENALSRLNIPLVCFQGSVDPDV